MRGIITIDVEISISYEDGPEKNNAYISDLKSIIIEQHEIIAQQTEEIAVLIEKIKVFEERLNKNSSNSSKPPSTDVFVNKKPRTKSLRKKSGKKPSGVSTSKSMVF